MFQLLHLHVDNWFELITLCEIAYPREKCKMECTGKISLCVTVMQQAENKMVCGVGPQFPSARRWHNGEHFH